MKIGSFNINDYLEKLYEESESSPKSDNSGGPKSSSDVVIIPDENKKAFSWLKREYDKSKVEVKVEIKMGGTKFEPGYDLQTDLKSVKDFKPAVLGNSETSSSPNSKKEEGVKKQPENKDFPNKGQVEKDQENKDPKQKETKSESSDDKKSAVGSKKIFVKTSSKKKSEEDKKKEIKESANYRPEESEVYKLLKKIYPTEFNRDWVKSRKHVLDSSAEQMADYIESKMENSISRKRLIEIIKNWIKGKYTK